MTRAPGATDPSARDITDAERRTELAAYAREQRVLAGIEQLRFFPLVVAAGEGARLITPAGRTLLDFSASWTASGFGHAHPHLVSAVQRAIAEGAGTSVLSAAVTQTTLLAERLLAVTPVRRGERAYLGLGGTDANSAALAACQRATGRPGILTFAGSYHGGNGLSQAASGMARADTSGGDVRVAPYPVTADELAAVRREVDALLSQRQTACVIVEALQCDGGVRVPAPGFLAALRDCCDRSGTLLIVDEVKAGLGRTGERYAYLAADILPDLVTLGKALGGGVPCSAVVGPAEVLDVAAASALLTLAGNPVSSAAAGAVLDLLDSGDLAAGAAQLGAVIDARVREYRGSGRPGAARIVAHRGRGLLWGIELDDADLARLTCYRAWETGCVVYAVRQTVLELTPPLVITREELDAGLTILFRALDTAATGSVPRDVLDRFGGW